MRTLGILIITSLIAALFTIAKAETCEALFKSAPAFSMAHESWTPVLERDYQDMLKTFGVNAEASVSPGMGHLLYQHWKLNPDIDGQLFEFGFKVVEPSADRPQETGRFVFPETYKDLLDGVERAQGAKPVFKFATYNSKAWYRLDEKAPENGFAAPTTDMDFSMFAKSMSEGYVPLWPSARTMGFIHDFLGHVTEFKEFPAVFEAQREFFSHYVNDGWEKVPYYRQRAEVFGEFSYILKPEKYDAVESYMVSSGIRFGVFSLHARQIRKAMKSDLPGVLAKIKKLTDAFDDLFIRHGGGARDFFTVDSDMLTKDAIETYVQAMKNAPSQGSYQGAVVKNSRIEALESLEGIKRQIQYVSDALTRTPSEELKTYLAYRVAQFEIAMLQQRKLELSQVDIIRDSILPVGVDSKTRRYFKSFQPSGSRHREAFVGK